MTAPALPKYPIESVDNALRLLRLVSESGSTGVAEASRHLDVAPSTAHRLLAMLQHHGFVERDAQTRVYRAGRALMDLGLAALREFDVRAVARPFLERLVADVGETAHLTTLQGTTVLFLDGVETGKVLRAGLRTGQSLPAHATAAGKAQLATLPEAACQELYPSETLPQVTRATLETRDALVHELDAIRRRGFATNQGESEEHLVAVAAAITDRAGTLRGAVTLAGPDVRLPARVLASVGSAVGATAKQIGKALSDGA